MALLRELRSRPSAYWAAAIVLAAVSAATWWHVLRSAEAARAAWGEARAVAVATRPLSPGETIGPEDVTTRPLPLALLPAAPAAVAPVGRIVTATMAAGEVVLEARLAPSGVAGAALVGTNAVGLPIPRARGGPPFRPGEPVAVVIAADPSSPARAGIVDGVVVSVSDEAVTVAVPADAAPALVAHLHAGRVALGVRHVGPDLPGAAQRR